jgi:hypothetical protein
VFHDPIEQHQRELSTLQTLAFLLTLMEALVAIQDQEEGAAGEKAGHASHSQRIHPGGNRTGQGDC